MSGHGMDLSPGGTTVTGTAHGIGTAILGAVIALAERSDRHVELNVLACNPARHLYARLGFRVVRDDGARLRMRK